MIVTVGIDPGTTSGVACWADGKLVYADSVRAPGYASRPRSVALKRVFLASGLDLGPQGWPARDSFRFITEDQFLGGGVSTKLPFKVQLQQLRKQAGWFRSSSSVVGNAAVWRCVADQLGGVILEPVAPQTWRAAWGISPKHPDKAAAAVKLVSDRLGKTVDEHTAEAVLLGLHAHVKRLWADKNVDTLFEPGHLAHLWKGTR